MKRWKLETRRGALAWGMAGGWLAAVALAMLPAVGQAADGAGYPAKEIVFVVPYPPGGNSDNLARIYADRLRTKLGGTIVIENKPGGTTSLGTGVVARAKPDGYTLLLATSTAFTVLPHLRNDLPYDPVKSFTFVGSLAGYLPVLAVRNEVPVHTLQEFVDYARKHPGKLSWGSAGVASGGHLAGEILKKDARLDMLHVPFKGSADSLTAMLGGHTDFLIDGVGLEAVKSGRARGIVTFASERNPELPNLPTPKESGFDVTLPFEGFWGVAVPAGTPQAIVDRLAKATQEILQEPDTRKRFGNISLSASWKTGPEYAKDIESSRAYYGDLLKTVNLSQ
ncbi:tripartite tricarboxylate transporter substrate binding protein [Diaphorobacter ruginosibacter]|uniref:Tripartite tricarboxylate transporter substrate binding protein n=1 Tax=Diaphorobacter ruginosibacter TaxID=1715720 RepID=A0A7G9RMQ6_9BURK|nr:tripartite tricarboxylate transporter substrate binding protein [Diaphorobacter ruginosibacter]QNN56881.1 tripartite tricarboxylate transporter substrate binding protein [Diaphorobacter ruginosibacter]